MSGQQKSKLQFVQKLMLQSTRGDRTMGKIKHVSAVHSMQDQQVMVRRECFISGLKGIYGL
jgi:hypothetical protein